MRPKLSVSVETGLESDLKQLPDWNLVKGYSCEVLAHDPEPTPALRSIFLVLFFRHADNITGICWPSRKLQVAELGYHLSEKAIQRAINEDPASSRYIEIVSRAAPGRNTVYRPAEWVWKAAADLKRKADKTKRGRASAGSGAVPTPTQKQKVSAQDGRPCRPPIGTEDSPVPHNGGQENTATVDAGVHPTQPHKFINSATAEATAQAEEANTRLNLNDPSPEVECCEGADEIVALLAEGWPRRSQARGLEASRKYVAERMRDGVKPTEFIYALQSYAAEVRARSGPSKNGVYRLDNWLLRGEWERFRPPEPRVSSSMLAAREEMLRKIAVCLTRGTAVPAAVCDDEMAREILRRRLATPDQVRNGVDGGPCRTTLAEWGFPIEEDLHRVEAAASRVVAK